MVTEGLRRCLFAAIGGVWFSGALAAGVDGLMLAAGEGDDQVDALRISLRWQWSYHGFHTDSWLLTGYWDASVSHWNNEITVHPAFKANRRASHEVWVVSFAPVLRWTRAYPTRHGLLPFLEAGVGGSLLSPRNLAGKGFNPRQFGMPFQFETRIGAGFRFGARQRFETALRKYHYSNAGLDKRNSGMNLLLLSYGWWF